MKWLSVVGIGEEGLAGLTPSARSLVDGAKVLVGGARHLAVVPLDGRERLAWMSPLSATIDDIVRRRGTAICVLATGDPMHYGVGVALARRIPAEEMAIIPSPSAVSLACARLGWAVADVVALTLHGRPLELLNAYLQPGARLVILSDGKKTPAAVAGLLRSGGFRMSRMWVLEHMGGPEERVVAGTAETWKALDIADFNTVAIECAADTALPVLPRIPGLPDSAFHHDGQLTKQEVRAITLAALAPIPGQLLWDVGAGCGSVAIEWMRTHHTCRAVAIERDADRRRNIADNASALGVPGLDVVAGEAPDALKALPQPDAAFVGGGLSSAGVVESCWSALKPGGRLVANAVTIEGEAELVAWQGRTGGALTRIAISRAEPVGGFHGWRQSMPVTQLAATKR
ncbi:MAG TPA: precorrin-6y C5,15-methyltransferase (decarboxylating) subunit CbiE [Alphaproteobacteria bacterium]|nr:precorrin-6y C5,15-methyltransferase (decarboxylating) subunit CbiE [Alphaproteobacteria bacterium]